MFLALWLVGACAGTAPARRAGAPAPVAPLEWLSPTPVTTQLSQEFAPAVSPDGKWLVFVSKRDGNYDLWIRPARGRGAAYPLTTHHSDDTHPAWSKNGKMLAFVSQREDALGDVWLMELTTKAGRPQAKRLVQVTRYKGADSHPSFSADSKRIVFTSTRGGQEDVWLYHIKQGRFKQITTAGGTQPDWSPVDDRIVFTAFRRPGPRSLGLGPGGDSEPVHADSAYAGLFVKQVTGDQPSQTPERRLTDIGPIYGFPRWSPDGAEIVFARIDHDTDRDGRLTPQDSPSICRTSGLAAFLLDPSGPPSCPAYPISTDTYEDVLPCWALGDVVYYTSTRDGNTDVWRVSATGPVPRAPDAETQLAFAAQLEAEAEAREVFALSEPRSGSADTTDRPAVRAPHDVVAADRALLAYQQVLERFPPPALSHAQALLRIGDLYERRGYSQLARHSYRALQREHPQLPAGNAEAGVRLALLSLDSALVATRDLDPSQRARQGLDARERLLGQFERIAAAYPRERAALAWMDVLAGETLHQMARHADALAAYRHVLDAFPEQTPRCAEARIGIGDIYRTYGSRTDVLNAYLKVLDDYPEEVAWQKVALERIAALYQRGEDPTQQIAGLQSIVDRYAAYPILVAYAHWEVGRLLAEQGDHAAALSEWELVEPAFERVAILPPFYLTLIAETQLQMAEACLALTDTERAQSILGRVMRDFRVLAEGHYAAVAQRRALEVLLDQGARLEASQDPQLALARYAKGRALDPSDVRSHRGWVRSLSTLGRIDHAVRYYETQCEARPEDAVAVYALGLAYSYKAERNPRLMQRSIARIERALEMDYRLVSAYLTLSFDYEAMERMGRGKKTLWYEKAIDALSTAIFLNDETADPQLEGLLALNLANNNYNLGEFAFGNALYYYQQKVRYDSTFTDRRQEAAVYERMGHCCLYLERYDEGARHLDRAIALYEELLAHSAVLRNLMRLGLLYQQKGDYEASNAAFRKAALKARLLQETEGRPASLETMHRNIAYNDQAMHEPEAAILQAQTALQLLAAKHAPAKKKNYLKIELLGLPIFWWDMGDMGGISKTEGFTAQDEKALSFTIIGQAYQDLGAYPQARSQIENKLALYAEQKDPLAEAIFTNNIGILYYQERDWTHALKAFERSLALCRKHGFHSGLVTNAVNVGNVHTVLLDAAQPPGADVSRAFPVLEEALKLCQDSAPAFERERIALLNTLGNLHQGASAIAASPRSYEGGFAALDSRYKALSYYEQALALTAQRRGLAKEDAVIRRNLAGVLGFFGEWEAAVRHLKHARDTALGSGYADVLWRVDHALGILAAQLEEAQQPLSGETFEFLGGKPSLEWLREAVSVLETLPEDAQLAGVRLSDLPERTDVYEAVIEQLSGLGRDQEALAFLERSKAKRVIDLIGGRNIELKRERHKLFWGNARHLQSRIGELGNSVRRGDFELERLGPGPSDRSKRDALTAARKLDQQELEALQAEYEALMETTRKEDPELASLVRVAALDPADIQRILVPDEAALAYFVGRRHLIAWALTPSGLRKAVVPVGRDALRDMLAQGRASGFDGGRWYELLIQPLAPALQGVHRLIIVPDDCLFDLPFALLESQGVPLIEHYALTKAASLQAYQYAYAKRNINHDTALVLGAGPGSGAQRLHEVFPGSRSVSADTLAKPAVKELLPKADYLVLAGGFSEDEADPLASYFSLGAEGQEYDPLGSRRLTAADLFGLDLRANLVVLAGGPGSAQAPSLRTSVVEQAFVYAGAPSVLRALWEPDPEAGDLFWARFFSYLGETTTSQALALAQRDVRQRYPDPHNWAGFELNGYGGMTSQEGLAFAQANFLHTVRLGNAFLSERKEYADAVKYYESALTMARQLGDSTSVAKLYNLVVRAAMDGQMYPKAIQYQRLLLDEAVEAGDPGAQALSLSNLSVFYRRLQQYDQAILYQQEYLQLLRRSGLPVQEAQALGGIAFLYESAGQYEQAIAYAQQWSQAEERLAAGKDADGVQRAEPLVFLGRLHLERDEYPAALVYLSQALALYESSGSATDQQWATLYQLTGLCHERLTRLGEALHYQQEALRVQKGAGDQRLLGQTYQYLANVYWKQGDYQQAFANQRTALALFDETGQKRLQLLGYSTLGLIHLSIGQPEKALEAERKALELAIDTDAPAEQATIHKNLGLIYSRMGDDQKALDSFRKAALLDERIGAQRGLAYDYRNLGNVLTRMGRYDEADGYLRRSLDLSQAVGDAYNRVQGLYGLGWVYADLGRRDQARQTLEEAAREAHALFLDDIEWRAQRKLAQTYVAADDPEAAYDHYRQAVSVIEAMRSRLKVEEYKSGFMDDKMEIYEDIVLLLLRMDRVEEAFEFAERAKSRNFVDMLGNADVDWSGGTASGTGRLYEEKKAAQADIAAMGAQIATIRSQSSGLSPRDQERLDALGRELDAARTRYADLMVQIRESDPELASVVEVDAWSLSDVQRLLGPDTALLEYYLTQDAVICWVITRDRITARVTKLDRGRLADQVIAFRGAIKKLLSTQRHARALYDVLVEPVRREIEGFPHLVIVPHGVLHYLPFNALMDADGRYMIDRFRCSFSASASVLGFSVEKAGGMPSSPADRARVLAVGNPDLGDPRYDLPFAEREIASIGRIYPHTQAYLGAEATERLVKERVSAADLVLLSCHGEYDEANPLFSGLLLAPDPGNDGRLEVHEILGLKLDASLVTLSACETGLGKVTGGDDVIGLTRGFAFAGAPSIIASLWKVDDLATAVTVKRLYRYLRQGESKMDSLRDAQLLVKEHLNAHPAYWASFYLTGSWM